MNANLLRMLTTLRIQLPMVSTLTGLSVSTSNACKFDLDLFSLSLNTCAYDTCLKVG